MNARTYEATLWALLALTLLGVAGARLGAAPWQAAFDNLHWTAGYAAGTLLAWRGWAEARDALTRAAKRWFFAGMVLLTIGQLVWDLQVAIDWLVFPAPSDLFFLSLGPALTVGLWTIGRTRLGAGEWRVARLDSATMLVAVLAASLALFLPRQGSYGALQIAVMAAYAVGLMAPVCLGLTLILALRARFVPATWLLPLAVLGFTAAWVVWNLNFLTGRLGDGDWLNISFSLLAVAVGAGIRIHRLDSLADARWDRRCEAVLRLQPLLMVVVAAGGLLLVQSIHDIHPLFGASVAVGCGAVVVLAAVRQHLQLGERDRLIAVEKLLRQREAELEARVHERTQELARAKDAAEVANRAKSAFLANMSHEIRTPMNSVLGLAHLALQATSEPQLRGHLEKVQASGRHLMGLIDDILDMSKIEAGRLELEQVPFQVAEVIAGVRAQLVERAREKGLVLRFDVDPALDIAVSGDPLRLGQVLLNLVGNAIKFTDAGLVTVRAWRLEGRTEAGTEGGTGSGSEGSEGGTEASAGGSQRLHFEVADTGVGIDDAARARLFQVFQQADPSTTRRHGGTGLGLAISRQLVELMGGEIGVDSEPGHGSRFWFTARFGDARPGSEPASASASASAAASAASSAPSAAGAAAGPPDDAALHGARILVVEDNEVNQIVATAMLRNRGAGVAVAGNGEEALAALRTARYDCVLMDVQMPVMDGLEATRRIRADPELAGLWVVGMTANAWQEDRARCLAAGMNDFTTKPIEPAQLYAAVARSLPPGGAARHK
ncbi:MAG: response regulator [Burkholderiales bacterium]|nr:response regulator [Burkholderiales bacterium]